MREHSVFIVMTFIVIVAIVMVSDSMTTAASLISLVASFFVIAAIGGKFARLTGIDMGTTDSSAAKEPTADTTEDQSQSQSPSQSQSDQIAAIGSAPFGATQEALMYGADYSNMRSYVTSFPLSEARSTYLATPTECTKDIDTLNAQMAARRTRDKRAMDGATIKDADYYRAHFADELAYAENAPWWGRLEM